MTAVRESPGCGVSTMENVSGPAQFSKPARLRTHGPMTAKKLAIDLMDCTGIARTLKPVLAGAGVIVGLHRVLAPGQPSLMPGNDISANLLRQMLEFFRQEGYDCIPLGQVRQRLENESTSRFAVLTFDDGYVDNLTIALPVFREFNAPFSVFVTSGFADRTALPWWALIEAIVLAHDALPLPVKGRSVTLPCRTAAEKQKAFDRLAEMGFTDTAALTATLETLYRECGWSIEKTLDGIVLSWQQVRTLQEDPLCTVGVHGVSHDGLTKMSDEECCREMAGAKQRIEQQTGGTATHIAYPFGWYGERELRYAREIGFEVGVTTERGTVGATHRDRLLALPRIMPSMAPHAGMSFIRCSTYGLWNKVANIIDWRDRTNN